MAELNLKQLDFINALAAQFVLAAEQSGLTGDLENVGKAKKAYVMDLLQGELDIRGIKISIAALSAIVESAVATGLGLHSPELVG